MAQDYFAKWSCAFALLDQKAATIVQVLRDHAFTMVGPSRRLHSNQGRNFESHILCKAFGVEKSHTTLYHPMGDKLIKLMNQSFLGLLKTLDNQSRKITCNYFSSRIAPPSIQLQNCPLLKYCLEVTLPIFSCPHHLLQHHQTQVITMLNFNGS